MSNFDLKDLRSASTVNAQGCWIWEKGKTSAGYGVLSRPGQAVIYAHRLAALLVHGPCPEGQEVMHACDIPSCCNPDHLRYGTRAENIADMRAKGRASGNRSRGETHTMAKLSEAQVLEIRRRRSGGEVLRVLAQDFGVSISAIHLVATRKKWTHV